MLIIAANNDALAGQFFTLGQPRQRLARILRPQMSYFSPRDLFFFTMNELLVRPVFAES